MLDDVTPKKFHHPKRYIQIRPKKDAYKYSFFPRTIRDWNQLSDELLDIESSDEFKSRLTKLYYGGWTTWTKDDDFIPILITCKYTHFWDFTVYTNNFVMLEDVTNTWVMGQRPFSSQHHR